MNTLNTLIPKMGFGLMLKKGKWSADQLAAWAGGTWSAEPNRPLLRVIQDSREIEAGDVYVALRGERFDGHDFVEAAAQAGAVAALVDDQWEGAASADIPCLVVPDTRAALVNMAANFRQTWSGNIIGITGSVGKTTVKELLADMLSSLGAVSRTRGNYNNDIGVPLSMLAAAEDDAFGVFEIGMNQPGEIGPLADMVRPVVGVMTPVGSAHVGNFASEDAVAEEKAALLERVDRNGFCVLSNDLPYIDLFKKRAAAPVVTVALTGEADWTGRFQGEDFVISLEGHDVLTCTLPIQAEFVARNVLLCVAVACRIGVRMEDIVSAIESFTPPDMRWQRSLWNGVEVINDSYNANPLSMNAALDALDQVSVPGTRWAVLGEMLELGSNEQQAHEELGARLVNTSCSCIAVGRVSPWIVQGALNAGLDMDRIFEAASKSEAVELLHQCVKPGDAVMLKASRGASLEQIISAWQKTSED